MNRVAARNPLPLYCSRQTKLQPLSLSVISGGYLFVNRRFSELFIKFLRGPIEFRYMEGNGPRQTQVLKSGQAELGFTSMWSFSKKASIRRMSSNGIEYHPLMDAVGIQPTGSDYHTPDETLYIDQVQPFWDLLLAVLALKDGEAQE